MDKQNYYVVSFSGGKDSTAMLYHLLELKYPVDEVVFCDTYKEFPQMYEHIKKVEEDMNKRGIKFTEIRNKNSFDYYFFDYKPKRRNPEKFQSMYGDATGCSWVDSRSRWCTGQLKIQVMDRYYKELSKDYNIIKYLGIAADEEKRLQRKNAQDKTHRYPLVEWGWTESNCLNYCYALGFDWGGLYQKFSRVSCWCCPLQSLAELRILRKEFPELWKELNEMDKKTWRQFRSDFSVEDLEIRFQFEEERLSQGESIRNREFFKLLRERLGEYKDE